MRSDLRQKSFAGDKQSGQAILIIVLVMLIGLTVGLSLVSRSTTDIKISTQLDESARAFAAAEAGIESALKGEAAGTYTIGKAVYTFSTSTAGGTSSPLTLGKIGIADTYTLWLTSHDTNGSLQIGQAYDYNGNTLDVCWDQGAMEITVIYQDAGAYKVSRGVYDPNSGRRTLNNFSQTEAVSCGGNFTSGKTITLRSKASDVLIALRLRPFYSEANVGVAPENTGQILPSQGVNISSSGTAGQTTRKVSVIQSYASLPAIFDYLLFSGGSLSKN